MDPCTMAPLFRGADGPNCKDIINGIAFSMPSCCVLLDTAIFLVIIIIRWLQRQWKEREDRISIR